MKKYILYVIVVILFSCTNSNSVSEEYNYIKITSARNHAIIVFEDFNDFVDHVGDNKEILLLNENTKKYFAIKENETLYLFDNIGYNTIEDYNKGTNLGFKESKDYYHSLDINCTNSEDYYSFIKSNFLSFDDFLEAKENGFLSIVNHNITLYYPIKYPDQNNIDIFNKYQKQYNNNPFSNRGYYIAKDNNFYRFILKNNKYNSHPSFSFHPNHYIEDIFYYGKLLNYKNPDEIDQYTKNIENNEFISEEANIIDYKRFEDIELKSYKLPEIRTRISDESAYTLIVDSRLVVLNKPQVINLINDKKENIIKIMREYLSSKTHLELAPQYEPLIKEEITELIINYLDMEYVYDINFLQFNVIKF